MHVQIEKENLSNVMPLAQRQRGHVFSRAKKAWRILAENEN